jgi:hypothetical protein
MMSPRVHLYWLTESGCDLGTPLEVDRLDPAIRDKVATLAGRDSGPFTLHLPFFDRRESRRRAEILRRLHLVREGDAIFSIPATPGIALRNQAATLLATHPAWKEAPGESKHGYFQTWQKVSTTLQHRLREWIPGIYFHDIGRFDDREAAYPFLVYQASRICHGRPRTEFTYDIAGPETLDCATHLIGRALQAVLSRTEQRLQAAGRPELARRYGPVWYEDVLRAVQKKPRPFIALLADEAMLINAVIDLGTAREMEGVKPFAKSALMATRSIGGEDMRALTPRALEEATKALGSNVLANKKQADG